MSSVSVIQGNRRVELSVPAGMRLSDLLRDNGFAIPLPCGGTGRCGKCRVSMTDSSGTRTVLSCQTLLTEDCTVTLPEAAGGGIIEGTGEAAVPTRAADCSAGTRLGPDARYGAAIDLGTTTVVVSLYELNSRRCLASLGDWNSQAPYGADVISRIDHTMRNADGLAVLQSAICRQLDTMLRTLCRHAGVDRAAVERITLAGNTVMQHIAAGLDPKSIAAAPFLPLHYFDPVETIVLPELGVVELMPCLAGYVGGDILAGLLACETDRAEGLTLFLDIGTNGEIVLGSRDGLVSCAVATGPAFEGAEIRCGMSSVPGAIRHITVEGEFLKPDVIGGGKPLGICGSGMIDLLAVLLDLGILDESGRLLGPDEAETTPWWLGEDEDENGIVFLTPDRSVFLTAADVRRLQLAKAAVAAGIEILLAHEGKTPADIQCMQIAGGFGKSLNVANAVRIGMLPPGMEEKAVAVGNTSLSGAARLLCEPQLAERLSAIRSACRYIELSGSPEFSTAYIDHMFF